MIQPKVLFKSLIPSACGLIGSLYFYFKSESIEGRDVFFSPERKEAQFYETVGDFFLAASVIWGLFIIARHVYRNVLKPTLDHVAPKIQDRLEELNKEKNLSKASEKLKSYTELRDAGVLSEAEYEDRVKELKTLL